ncbi:unnamed protein product [Spodoptera littoralis]|uniref:Uncharacterized protein n=1 Tax=Spodoptera littoralis TaxID=7109 RepID=A0A9P0IC05_SPOLI|nr:unnamed protein product [Spodoptera littoralis]CAH1644022.1 unnamed protein product [Spodoptera littoralis]
MESSSDNSFAWTDTSTDSVNSTSMATNAFNVNDSCKSDRRVKKKKENLSRINESIDLKAETDIKQEANFSSIKNCIKVEPDSVDGFKKKKRNKHLECNGTKIESQDSASYDETYLNMKVKLEETSVVSSQKHKQKKRKHSSSVDSNSTTSNCEVNHEHTLNQESEVDTTPPKSKKIKKLKKEDSSNNHDEMYSPDLNLSLQDETFSNNESNYNNCSVIENNTLQDGSDEESNDEISAIKCDDSHVIHAISFIDKGLEKSKSQTKRISDRIRFEDDNDSTLNESSPEEDEHSSEYSKKPLILKKVLKNNPNLKQVLQSFKQNTQCINQNDEIWILKCPREINISDFTNTTLNIHGKCKVKLAGQTYEGTVEEEQSDALSLLALDHNKLKIKTISPNGAITLRKRIPKAHFRDDNIMVNNQINFIPLPETKCRHPLFGSDYKKSLKIPAAISERLNTQANEEIVKTEKRKKKKDNKNDNKASQIDLQELSVFEMKSEPGLPAEVREKKKKKRKLLDDEGPAKKKAKRVKTDPESAEAWESEKAIEENLFNF